MSVNVNNRIAQTAPRERDTTGYAVTRLPAAAPRREHRFDHGRKTTAAEERAQANRPGAPAVRPGIFATATYPEDVLAAVERLQVERNDIRATVRAIVDLVFRVARADVLAILGRDPSPDNEWTRDSLASRASALLADGHLPRIVALTLLAPFYRPHVGPSAMATATAAKIGDRGLAVPGTARPYSGGDRTPIDAAKLRERREAARLGVSALARRAAEHLLGAKAEGIRNQLRRAEEKGAALPVEVERAVSAALVEAEDALAEVRVNGATPTYFGHFGPRGRRGCRTDLRSTGHPGRLASSAPLAIVEGHLLTEHRPPALAHDALDPADAPSPSASTDWPSTSTDGALDPEAVDWSDPEAVEAALAVKPWASMTYDERRTVRATGRGQAASREEHAALVSEARARGPFHRPTSATD
jgi:hypothetical protein